MIARFLPIAVSDSPGIESTILVPQLEQAVRRGQSDSVLLDVPVSTKRKGVPARRIFGDYEVIDEISRGGMGVVYRARQRQLNRIVALKTTLPTPFPSQSAAIALRFEAEVGASLDHPGIVPIHDAGEVEGRPYICMTLIEGESLATRLKRGPLSPKLAARIVAEAADAIQYVHDCGFLHRDVKPGNILLDAASRARLIDFGLAIRANDRSTTPDSGYIVGTPSYMSPEQASGRSDLVGPTSDVYSLGAVLYELLTGRPPFDGGSSQEILRKICQSDLRVRNTDTRPIPADLQFICHRALQKSAEARYASAAKLANDLRRVLASMR